jgi:hypothetical protein
MGTGRTAPVNKESFFSDLRASDNVEVGGAVEENTINPDFMTAFSRASPRLAGLLLPTARFPVI